MRGGLWESWAQIDIKGKKEGGDWWRAEAHEHADDEVEWGVWLSEIHPLVLRGDKSGHIYGSVLSPIYRLLYFLRRINFYDMFYETA